MIPGARLLLDLTEDLMLSPDKPDKLDKFTL